MYVRTFLSSAKLSWCFIRNPQGSSQTRSCLKEDCLEHDLRDIRHEIIQINTILLRSEFAFTLQKQNTTRICFGYGEQTEKDLIPLKMDKPVIPIDVPMASVCIIYRGITPCYLP